MLKCNLTTLFSLRHDFHKPRNSLLTSILYYTAICKALYLDHLSFMSYTNFKQQSIEEKGCVM